MSALARRSALVLSLLFGLLFAIGTGLLWYWNEPVWYALLFAFVVLGFQFLLGPILIDHIFAIRWTESVEVSPEFDEWFLKTCEQAQIRMPRFGIIRDGNPNAFAYGRTRGDARIVVTSGLIQLLSPQELQAVVAHEIGHVANRDFIVMTVAQAVPLALYILYTWTRRRSGNYGWAVSIGAYVVYILSQYIVLVLSRVRESFADERSALTTHDPNALASALVKISYGLARQQESIEAQKRIDTAGKKAKKKESFRSTLTGSVTGAVAAMGIANLKSASGFAFTTSDASGAFSPAALANALEWELKNPWARWFELHSTHPLTGRRVRTMSETAKRFGLAPLYEASQALATREYTGNFAKEFLIFSLPLVSALVGFAIGWARPNNVWSLHLAWYALIGYGIGRLIKTAYVYPQLERPLRDQSGLGGAARTIESLVTNEINASHVNGVPCIIEGKIIGRGVPGLFWSKDLVLRDDTGLIQIIYRQPLGVLELWFGVSKAENVVGHPARVQGWYRRAPVPYVEISRVELTDSMQTMRCYYKWGSYAIAMLAIGLGAALAAWW
jgi:heat shock protein HtpX